MFFNFLHINTRVGWPPEGARGRESWPQQPTSRDTLNDQIISSINDIAKESDTFFLWVCFQVIQRYQMFTPVLMVKENSHQPPFVPWLTTKSLCGWQNSSETIKTYFFDFANNNMYFQPPLREQFYFAFATSEHNGLWITNNWETLLLLQHWWILVGEIS